MTARSCLFLHIWDYCASEHQIAALVVQTGMDVETDGTNGDLAFHSIGIDVFKTVNQLGLPLYTLADRNDPNQNWYSAVFIE